MKKLLSIAAVALMGTVLLTSCKKDYTCTCTINGERIPATIQNVNKAQAKTACKALEIAGASDCSVD